MNNADKVYLDLLREVREEGIRKSDRTGTGTVSVFGRTLKFDMKEGFPLLTTKKIHTKSVIHELLWFLQGGHNIKYLVDNGVNIWNEWPWQNYNKNNPDAQLTLDEFITKIKEDAYLESEEERLKKSDGELWNDQHKDSFADVWGELGPVYGKQWRQWQGWLQYESEQGKTEFGSLWYDQILRLIQDLKTNPDSRRLMVNAWNVSEIDKMLLPPCHYGFQCWTRELSREERYQIYADRYVDDAEVVDGGASGCTITGKRSIKSFLGRKRDNGGGGPGYHETWLDSEGIPSRAISLMWQQRSVDLFLGLPFNIASYGLLLEMIGQSVGMLPEELIFNGGDCHIYVNHFDQVDEQLKRVPMELCKVKLAHTVFPIRRLKASDNNQIIEYEYNDIEFIGYKSHPAIKAPIAI